MSPKPPLAPYLPARPDPSSQAEAIRPDSNDDELAAAAWLYAWSHEALPPIAESLAARIIAAAG